MTRDFIFTFISQFTFSIAFHILYPTLPIYLSRLGSTETDIGVLIGIMGVSSLVSRPFVGRALSKTPEKKFMIMGALFFAFTSAAYLLAFPFWPFFTVPLSRDWSGLLLYSFLNIYLQYQPRIPEGTKPQLFLAFRQYILSPCSFPRDGHYQPLWFHPPLFSLFRSIAVLSAHCQSIGKAKSYSVRRFFRGGQGFTIGKFFRHPSLVSFFTLAGEL